MQFSSFPIALLLTLAFHSGVHAAASDDKKEKVVEPCTVASTTGSFYDLRSLSISLPEEGKKIAKGEKTDDWHAKGYDYHDSKANFTLNICAPVVGKVEDIEGIDKKLWKNTSAHYQLGSKIYSIG
jgi:cation-dependent mannose-6-phosphate receptor